MVLARRVFTALLLGAVTSVAVAWSFVSLARSARAGPTMHEAPDATIWMTPDYAGLGWRRTTMWPATGVTEYGRTLAERFPSWALPLPATEPPDSIIEIVGAGWPVVCVRGHRTGRDDTEAHIARTGTIMTGLGPQAIAWNERVGTYAFAAPTGMSARGLLPWLPVWRGLAVDSVVLGLPWLLLLSVGAMRRRLRRRSGRCASCGYLLQGSATCPECGHGCPYAA